MGTISFDIFQQYMVQFIGKKELLTYDEISKLLSLNIRTLYNDKSLGLLKPLNGRSRNLRFSSSEIYAYAIVKRILPGSINT